VIIVVNTVYHSVQTFVVKGKLKRPQSLCQLRGRCITI